MTTGAHDGHPASAQLELMASLRAFRHVDAHASAGERRHFDLCTQACRRETDRHAAVEVVTVALKERMGRDRKENIEIARRAAVEACLTLTGKANPRAFLNAGRNINC